MAADTSIKSAGRAMKFNGSSTSFGIQASISGRRLTRPHAAVFENQTRNPQRIDNNKDELIKALAVDAFEAEGFRWDAI